MLSKFTLQHGNIMLTEVVEIPEEIKRIPGRQSQAKGILMFSAENLPALGAKIYKVQRDPSNVQYPRASEKRIQMRFDYDENSFVINDGRREIKLEDDFLYYKAKVGINDKPEHRASGAYIFR